MADILEKTTTYGMTQSAIDTLAFFGVNYLGNSLSPQVPKPKADKVIIFFASDMMVRNDWISYWKNKIVGEKKTSIALNNAYIAAVSLVLGTLYDLLKNKNLGEAFTKNLINNGLGLLGNVVVDNLMIDKSYV